MAMNESSKADEFGEYDDWIELYNSSDRELNLGGLYLTDDLDEPLKYQVPFYDAGTSSIPPGAYCLFWADGSPEQGVMHLGFRLDQGGEQIGLVQVVDGAPYFLDSLSFTTQRKDMSRGRYTDGKDTWYAFQMPTPLASNIWTGIEKTRPARVLNMLHIYPNPFSEHTTISFDLENSSPVQLWIYDFSGRELVTLVDHELPAGHHEVQWSATTRKPGMYICILSTRFGSQQGKVILTR